MVDGATLSDLSVVEYAQGVAGPYCGKLLADLGADAVKVEPPGGDRSRRNDPFPGDVPHPERSGQFLYLNAGKRGVTLDLEQARGRELFLELLRDADVLIIDLPPSRLAELEIDYPRLEALNERLIMTCVTPFGQAGPYREYRGTAHTTYQASGLGRETPAGYVTDLASQPPLSPGNPQADYFTGVTAATDTMVAVFHRAAYGRGQLVDVAGMEANANHVRPTLSAFSHTPDLLPGRAKSTFGQVMPAADGHIFLAPYAFDHWWQGLQRMMGDPQWATNDTFATREGRTANVEVIEPLVRDWAAQHPKREIYELAIAAHVPCFPVSSAQEMVESPQFVAREFYAEVQHPVAGGVLHAGAPVRYSVTQWAIRRPAPRLGEHNEEVLGALGQSPQDLAALAEAGVIAGNGA